MAGMSGAWSEEEPEESRAELTGAIESTGRGGHSLGVCKAGHVLLAGMAFARAGVARPEVESGDQLAGGKNPCPSVVGSRPTSDGS